jgi:hypothetical protein
MSGGTMRIASTPLAALMCLLSIPACMSAADSDAGDAEDAENAAATGKADSPAEGSADARRILALVNDPSVMEGELDESAGLSNRVAEAIITKRKGADTYADTADDDLFDTLAELDAIPYLGPTAMTSLLSYARRTETSAKLYIDLIATEYVSGSGNQMIALTELNDELAGLGLPPFRANIELGGRDDRSFNLILGQLEALGEKLNRSFELQRGWDPSEYQSLCYTGPLSEVASVVENLRGSLFSEYMGIQGWRWKTTKKMFIEWAESYAEWERAQREDNGNDAEVDAWEAFNTSSNDFLMLTDGGQQGDGTELFAVRIPPCYR